MNEPINPNDALELARRASQDLTKNGDDKSDVEFMAVVAHLVAAFDALDEWLTRGGFPPRDWAPGFNPPTIPTQRNT